MKKFTYIATDENGVREEGSIHSPAKDNALKDLKEQGKIIISIKEEIPSKWRIFDKPSMSVDDKMVMTNHLATMINSGITITESFQILIDQSKKPNNKKMFEDILGMINAGQNLSDSLAEYPEVFSEIFVNMVAVGEKSGTLVEVLRYLQEQLEKEADIKRKVISAFVYPAVIVSMTVMLMFGIVFFIMPKILKIFSSFDVVLPLPTRILIGLTAFMTDKPLTFMLTVLIAIVTLVFLFKAKFLKPFWHQVVLHTPVFGKILIYVNLARFSRSLNSLLRAGVAINKALEITSRMFSDEFYKKIVMDAKDKVEKGMSLEAALNQNEKLFPILVIKMLDIGERTGNLEETTEHLAELYEQYVDNLTKNLSVLLEPILLVFMGALVGSFALAIIMPIYQLPNLIQN